MKNDYKTWLIKISNQNQGRSELNGKKYLDGKRLIMVGDSKWKGYIKMEILQMFSTSQWKTNIKCDWWKSIEEARKMFF